MRPYIAVIKDCFREALASRVLWILLILTTVMLLAVAPFSIKDHRPSRLHASTIFDWPGLINRLKTQAAESGDSPGKRIWNLLEADLQQKLEALPEDSNTTQISSDLSSAVVSE